MKVKFLLTFVLSLAFFHNVLSNIFTVTKADGNLPATTAGSLKKAINDASVAGRDTIRFNVPGDKVSVPTWSANIQINHNNLFVDGINPTTGNSITLDLTLESNANKVDFYGVKFNKNSFHAVIIKKNNNSIDSCFFNSTGAGKNSLWINGGNSTDVTNSVFTGSDGHAISVENGGGHFRGGLA